MKFYQNLYTDEFVCDKIDMIKKKLKKHQAMLFVHIVTLPITNDGILEIYPASVLIQKAYQKVPFKVVGIASDQREAFHLVERIVMDCLNETGCVDLKNYLKF